MLAGAITRVGGTPRRGTLACDGSTFDPAKYPALYAALGDSNVLPNIPGTPMYVIWTHRQLVPPGTIAQWPGISPPAGALPCDGGTFSAAEHPGLYEALGNSTTLPDMPGTPIYVIWAEDAWSIR
jgi:hypothetical protein